MFERRFETHPVVKKVVMRKGLHTKNENKPSVLTSILPLTNEDIVDVGHPNVEMARIRGRYKFDSLKGMVTPSFLKLAMANVP